MTPTHFFYAAKDNLVAKSRTAETTQSAVWCLNRDRITCVTVAHDGARVAFGDEKGKVTVLKWKNGQFEAHKEHFLLMGIVNEILWSADDKCLVALGENKGQCAACNPESGSRMGDVLGFTSTVLCGVLTAEKVLYSAGEGSEILMHQGIPFKGQGKKIVNPHSGFVNQMRMSPDGSKFATCSADKSIAVFDAKEGTVIKHF